MIEAWMVALAAGGFGLCIGSFLNVCTLRWPNDESVVAPRSRCPGCGETIAWHDNLPVVSYVLLRGRCRRCRTGISLQYPLVELATGLAWAGTFLAMGLSFEALRASLLLTLLLGIALSDARFYIIPDEFSLGGTAMGIAMAPLPGGPSLRDALMGAAVGYVLLWAVARLGKAVFRKDAMGGGDVKMMAMVGAFLGIQGVLLTVFLGALLGALLFGPISLRTGKLVPFGIFLAAGAAIGYGWGDAIVAWYLDTVLGLGGS